jgi:hypothetical protein
MHVFSLLMPLLLFIAEYLFYLFMMFNFMHLCCLLLS